MYLQGWPILLPAKLWSKQRASLRFDDIAITMHMQFAENIKGDSSLSEFKHKKEMQKMKNAEYVKLTGEASFDTYYACPEPKDESWVLVEYMVKLLEKYLPPEDRKATIEVFRSYSKG